MIFLIVLGSFFLGVYFQRFRDLKTEDEYLHPVLKFKISQSGEIDKTELLWHTNKTRLALKHKQL